MRLWLKRSLFLIVAGVAAWIEGYYLAPYGFEHVAFALLITVILAIRLDGDALEGVKRRKAPMTKYLFRNCPRCAGYLGIILRDPGPQHAPPGS